MTELIEQYFDKLWPINRSLTGNGNRKTLEILKEIVSLEVKEIPSGTACFDWFVPPEWNLNEAWIKNSKGEKILDFNDNNLHILGYSDSYSGIVSFDELKKHLYSIPEKPDLIPYRTSYYEKIWGFCLSHNSLMKLDSNDKYEVFIDSSFNQNGTMTIGEAYIKGESNKEILISTYICHPSMAINELSGPLVAAFMYNILNQNKKHKYSYRFLFIPETIGSIYNLSVYGEFWKKNLIAGFVVTCIGHNSSYTYKKSRDGNSLSDRATETILKQQNENFRIIEFFPGGSDERQYCSPGFNLPIGSLMRTMYGQYNEYHTSGDNKSIISFDALNNSISTYIDILELIDKNEIYINNFPMCEPQLGIRGLYPTLGSNNGKTELLKGMMWLLNLSDGNHDLIEIANKSKTPVQILYKALDKLLANGLLSKKIDQE